MPSLPTLLALVALASLAPSSEAHTRMIKPQATFPKGLTNVNFWIGLVDSKQFYPGAYNNTTGAANLAKLMAANGTTQTLREFVAEHVKLQPLTSDGTAPYTGSGTATGKPFTPTLECGHSLTTGAKQPFPELLEMRWTHPGPCEFWCDNTRVFFNENCQANKVGPVALDKTKCAGASLIQGTLVAVHAPRWQVFTNCVPMEGGKETDPTKVFNVKSPPQDDDDEAAGEGETKGPSVPTTPKPSAAPKPAASKCGVAK